jgi:hypothetical protein
MINVEQLSYINLIRLTKEKGCEIEFPTTKYMKEFLTQLNNTYQYVISKPHCTNKITQLQNWWRRTRPQFDGLRISMNTVDPFSMIDICDIPKNYRITLYERQNKVIYTFDIRYLYIQMNNEGSLTNPFTQTKFNDISIKRVNDKVQWLKKHDIDVQLDDELLTDDQLLVRRYEQIVCKINRLGYTHVNLDWLLMTCYKQTTLYCRLAYIWHSIVSDELKKVYEHMKPQLFNDLYLLRFTNGHDLVVRQILISDLERMFDNSIEQSVQSQCVIYLLNGLNGIHKEVSEYYIDIVQI